MRTVDEALTAAPPDVCFHVAADVERWPEVLPHYRWVHFREKRSFATGVVEMAAWRHFGPIGYPTWWVSHMEHDAAGRRVLYRHVEGITRGMDVEWRIQPRAGGTRVTIVHEWTGPPWPLIGGLAAKHVIGPHFISFIASRTLAGVTREAERRAST